MAIALGVSLALKDNVGLAIDIGGIVGINLMAFIAPCYLFCLSRQQHSSYWILIASAIVCVGGVILCPLGIYAVVKTLP